MKTKSTNVKGQKWKGKVNVLSKCKQLKSKDESGKKKTQCHYVVALKM
jgi:hypothetical protein